MTEAELREIEQAAVELARGAGKLLMGYFRTPLGVTYKSPNRRDPVTDADKASDAYLRAEVQRRFPTHAILSEEDPAENQPADGGARMVWVVDPLDGTINFLNSLPIFGVSIGVLNHGRPVVGAIFLPSVHDPEGSVFHARAGGGAFCDGVPIATGHVDPDSDRPLAAMPSYFPRMFRFRPHIRRRLGDVRSTGSVAFEMAFIARGVFRYGVYNGPRIWDLAGGIVLVQEAEGAVMVRDPAARRWKPFQGFGGADTPPTLSQLRAWRGAMVVGTPQTTELIVSGLSLNSYRWRRLWRRLQARLWRRERPTPPAGPAAEPGPQEAEPSPSKSTADP